jgi:hypothetical protein
LSVRTYRHGSGQGHRGVDPDRLRSGGAMPAFRDITDPEASDIAAWIVSLQRPAASGGEP